MNKCLCYIIAISITLSASAQPKTVFYNNVTFTVPAGWYIKDSTASKVMLRRTGDEYSKLEVKWYAHNEKDLSKYMLLDKKKFSPDPHTKTILPDVSLGGKLYKRVKYYTKSAVLKVDSELEYIALFKPRFPLPKMNLARLEIILTYPQSQEAAMVRVSDALVASIK